MMKLAALLAFTIACGGGSGTDVGGGSSTQPDGGVALDSGNQTDAGSQSTTDGGMTTAAGPATRAIVSGARRLHGANGLIVDVEVGHALDQGVRTSGPLIVRGGAANLAN